MELQDELYEEIVRLCSEGDELVDASKFNEAIEYYLKALELVPSPKTDWEASTWIYTALGDTCFLKNDFDTAKHFLFDAMNCPDGIWNPFINLRLGQCFYELNELNRAKEYLLRAYMYEGINIFQEDDVKYFDLIKGEV
jgi:tetratricopeptide (TPR) repeat protein